jgi:hypothetical protein
VKFFLELEYGFHRVCTKNAKVSLGYMEAEFVASLKTVFLMFQKF